MVIQSNSGNDVEISRFLTGPLTPLVIEPVVLEGQFVRLEPLSMAHQAGLCAIGLDEDLWRWIPSPVATADDMHQYITLALKLRDEGSALPFATIHKADNRVVGSTRYLNIDKTNRHVEIGATFVGKPWQRSVVNTEAKYLMLRHAFDVMGCIRVEFKTDSLNIQSQNALARLGATREGLFRNHIICKNGRIRHSVYFSIRDDTWPTIKTGLETKIARS